MSAQDAAHGDFDEYDVDDHDHDPGYDGDRTDTNIDLAIGPVAVPVRWPSAWPHLRHAARRRAVFVGGVMALTEVGIVVAGEPLAEWWVPMLPLLLLAGPLSRPARVRKALRRAAARGRTATMSGRVLPGPVTSGGHSVHLVTGSGRSVRLPATATLADVLATRHAGHPAVLVWTRRLAGRRAVALVLHGPLVAYLPGVPRGARMSRVPVGVTAGRPELVGSAR